MEREHHSRLIPFGRLPFYALVFKPIAALPYAWGRLTWWLANALAMAGFVWLWPLKKWFWLAVAIFWSLPLAMLLHYGQDTALFLLFATGTLFLLLRRQDIAAGLVLAVCASKFHLALALPVFLAANRRWRAIAGAVAGVLAILAVSFATEGPGWPLRLVELSRLPGFDPAPWRMPNIAGLIRGGAIRRRARSPGGPGCPGGGLANFAHCGSSHRYGGNAGGRITAFSPFPGLRLRTADTGHDRGSGK